MNDRLVNLITLVITAAWLSSFVLDAIVKDYEPPQTIHLLMLAVAGAAYGTKIVKRNGGSHGD